MARGSSFSPDARDPRLRVPSGSLNLGAGAQGDLDRAPAAYSSVTGGVRSSRASGGGMPRTYTGKATNPLGRR